MTSDRARGIRRAETLLRQGLLDQAIAEYVRLAQDRPDDWPVLNALGNLYLRARRIDAATEQYCRIAEHLHETGSTIRALEIYTRLLRLTPESPRLRLGAATELKTIAGGLAASGRPTEALAHLRRALEYDPSDAEVSLLVVRAALDAGDLVAARRGAEGAAQTPALLVCRLEVELRAGDAAATRSSVEQLLREAPAAREAVIRLGHQFAGRDVPAAFECIEALVDHVVAGQDWRTAAEALKGYASRVRDHIPALMRLVEVCVDGGLEADLLVAQRLLADGYLRAGQAREARVIAEDLALREPWERGNMERFRRALVMLGEPDPDTVIADRLCGESPFAGLAPFPGTDEPTETVERPATRPAARSAAPPVARTAAPPAAPPVTPSAATPPAQAEPQGAVPLAASESDLAALAVTAELQAALAHHAAGRTAAAVAALRQAARTPKHRFEAALLLGRVQEQAGALRPAIEWYERAADAAPSRDAAHDVLYDLARVLLADGEADRALAVFLELRAEVPSYRDVAWQIARLRHGREDARPSARVAG